MNRRRPFPAKSLLKLIGLLTVSGASKAWTRSAAGRLGSEEGVDVTAKPEHRPTTDAGDHSKREDLVTYGVGYVLALALTCLAFALVHWRWASARTAFAIVLGLALAQALVHFRCFLHVTLKRSARDDLQLILFSTLIVCLMVGGTLVVLFNLRMRMM